jgi:hypothetical protein
MSASDSVWALASGLPSEEHGRLRLMVVQASIDDSGSDSQSTVFVQRSFIADHWRRAAFSDEWQAALDEQRPPP